MVELSSFKDKLNINVFDLEFAELRTGDWSKGLDKPEWKKGYYHRYYRLISEIEKILFPKLLPEEKEQLGILKNNLNNTKQKVKEDYIVDDEFGNGNEVWSDKIDYDRGLLILKEMESLFRGIIERLTKKVIIH